MNKVICIVSKLLGLFGLGAVTYLGYIAELVNEVHKSLVGLAWISNVTDVNYNHTRCVLSPAIATFPRR